MYAIQVALELLGLAAVGLGEHHHRLGIAVERQHQRACHAVEQHLSGTERLHDQHAIYVGAEHLTLAAGTATPTLKARTARQHALDHAHVVAGRTAHRYAVAHGRQQDLVLAARLSKSYGVLGTERISGSRHQWKPAVQAHHGAQLHLLWLLGLRAKIIEGCLLGGISGFPRMSESPYDAFGGGHASVSISAAFGMAKAAEMRGERHQVVAVIGDGSMTGGLAFEGLNNAGASKRTNILVILNDNNMAIDQATGALKNYLLKISTSVHYNRFKQRLWGILSHTPRLLRLCQKAGNAVKQGVLNKSNLFESFNFRYFGPVDGHNLKELVRTLRALRDIEGPKLLHVMTVKGKGYLPAEHDQSTWHAPGRFNPDTGERIASPGAAARYQDVFGETLVELAGLDPRAVGVTPAMPSGCSMNMLMHAMPSRCFDVGIAEGHAVTFSAGMAAAGMVPFCNIYSSFMQRAYDNVIHDVAIQDLPVVMCLDRGGIVGEDGVTHHGVFDMAAFGAVPGLTIAAPMDELELRNMMYTGLQYGHPFMIRYPRGNGAGRRWRGVPFEALPVGRGRRLREGTDVALVTVGTVGNAAARAAERAAAKGVSVAHYDLRFAKPLDEALLAGVGAEFRHVVTVEDGSLRGGVGEAVTAFFNARGCEVAVHSLGIGDEWVEHGTPAQLYALCGYDEEGILRALLAAGK